MKGRFQGPWSPAIEAAHRELSPLDLDFRRFALDTPELLDRAALHVFDQNQDILKFRLQPWPTFVAPRKMTELRRLSVGISNLLKTLPRRLFRDRLGALARFYGLPSAAAATVLLEEPNGIAEAVGRGDFIHTRSGFQCIEFNFTPNVGGWETSVLIDLHLAVPATRSFLERRGVQYGYVNTLRSLHQHVLGECLSRELCQGRIEIALLLRAVDLDHRIPMATELLDRELRNVLAEVDGDLKGGIRICSQADLSCIDGAVFHDGTRIHAIVDYTDERIAGALYRCLKAQTVVFLNGPIAAVLSDKRNLALVSEFADSGLFDAGERELIRRCVPWTRRVVPEDVIYNNGKHLLPRLLIEEPEAFVMKAGRSFGGKDVLIGKHTPEAVWAEAVQAALDDGTWVVQERLDSLPYLFQSGPYGCAAHDVIWGPFVFGDRYAGVILRMQPTSEGAPVNLSQKATEGIVLEVP